MHRATNTTQTPSTHPFLERDSNSLDRAKTASVVYWSEFLTTDPEARVRFPELLDFLRSSGSGTGSTQPREYN
jgi:hypothetical protein